MDHSEQPVVAWRKAIQSLWFMEYRISTPSGSVTQLLKAWGEGDPRALEKLTPLVYAELHRLATHCMAVERPDHTLQPTALVHEVYLRLIDSKNVAWKNRAHFFALSARLMRRILVDCARSRRYEKRGGGRKPVSLEEITAVSPQKGPYLLMLDDALTHLAEVDSRKSEVVELRFFGGLNLEEIAEVLRVSRDTVLRDWKMARLWLLREIANAETNET
jgi:RNA polymerase sigma-70 factor (ECF subfamily)